MSRIRIDSWNKLLPSEALLMQLELLSAELSAGFNGDVFRAVDGSLLYSHYHTVLKERVRDPNLHSNWFCCQIIELSLNFLMTYSRQYYQWIHNWHRCLINAHIFNRYLSNLLRHVRVAATYLKYYDHAIPTWRTNLSQLFHK